jgi:hypothetical protein
LARKPDVPCARCGVLGFSGKGSRPAGEYTCRPCRRAFGPVVYPKGERVVTHVPCSQCGEQFLRHSLRNKFCSIQCANRAAGAARSLQELNSSKSRYTQRRAAAPGLSYSARERLLQKWKRQCRSCAYCPAPATSIDHVVPLIRGGTNFEGNLAPVCRPCNSSKREWLLTEWRTGRRCTTTVYVMPSPPRPPRTPPSQCEVTWKTCTQGHPYTTRGKRRCDCPWYTPRTGPRTLSCQDCSNEFVHVVLGGGKIPIRCDPCRTEMKRERNRQAKRSAWARKRELRTSEGVA